MSRDYEGATESYKYTTYKYLHMEGTSGPEMFYKGDFCRTVCGHTDDELRTIIRDGYVEPLAQQRGFDEPRSDSDKLVDNYMTFMAASFQFPLLDISIEDLYEAFRKFREYEEHIHPRSQFSGHEECWGPIYRKIEEAFQSKDYHNFKQGIIDLVDMIIHD